MAAKTLTERGSEGRDGGAVEPVLFHVLQRDRLRAAPSRHALGGLAEVVIGRGDTRAVERAGGRLTLRVPDRWMSGGHARLVLGAGGFEVEDLGSRNGTHLGRTPVEAAALLRDGDVIEMGRTFFVFRDEMDAGGVLDVDAESLPRAPAGLATLLPGYAAELSRLVRVARTPVSVVLRGETGSGKEVLARALHALSGRDGRFVAVDCAALPETLREAELFGHRRGAFSGAVEERLGWVRSADGGTLFLDEVGELAPGSQAALLRVLQERAVVPLGSTQPVPVDVRLVCATHRELDAEVAAGRFRADLLARLSGVTVRLPPLRERREDLGILIAAILPRVAPGLDERVTLEADAMRALLAHTWPQNVRELEKCLGAAVALAGDESIRLEHLSDAVRAALATDLAAPEPRPLPADAQRRAQLVALLAEHQGNVAAVARALGKGRQQIHRWLERYRIDIQRFRRREP